MQSLHEKIIPFGEEMRASRPKRGGIRRRSSKVNILSFLSVVIGWLLFGVTTLRARVYPRLAAVLLIVEAVVSLAPIPLSGIVLSVAVAWLGFVLFTVRGMLGEQPSRVS